MASGGKRGAGDRVLESRHVIGLFMLMLLFSGVFFALGYVMGRNQYEGQVRAASNYHGTPESEVAPKPEPAPKHSNVASAKEHSTDPSSDPATSSSGWGDFYDGSKSSKPVDDHLKPVAPPVSATPKNVAVHAPVQKAVAPGSKSMNAPLIPAGSYTLQVAALTKQADALDLASRLQKKKFPAVVLSSQADKYFRVQVGPYPDQKSTEIARKGLEAAGFKAIVKH